MQLIVRKWWTLSKRYKKYFLNWHHLIITFIFMDSSME